MYDCGEVSSLLLTLWELMMKQSMIIDKSDRVNAMLVFEGLPVQFYELDGAASWLKSFFLWVRISDFGSSDGFTVRIICPKWYSQNSFHVATFSRSRVRVEKHVLIGGWLCLLALQWPRSRKARLSTTKHISIIIKYIQILTSLERE